MSRTPFCELWEEKSEIVGDLLHSRQEISDIQTSQNGVPAILLLYEPVQGRALPPAAQAI